MNANKNNIVERKTKKKMKINNNINTKSTLSIENLLAASSSLENLQNDGTMYSNDMVAKVINGQLDALSTLEDGSTLNFITAPDNVENNITAQTRKAKRKSTMSYTIPQRPENTNNNNTTTGNKNKNSSNSSSTYWKRPIAQMINDSHPPISPLRSNLSRTGKNSDAGKKHMLHRVGYNSSNYYLKAPPSQFNLKSSILHVPGSGERIRKGRQEEMKGQSITSPYPPGSRRNIISKDDTIRDVSSPIRGGALLERYSILPDIMKAVSVLNEQTDRAREGAKLLHTFRQKNGIRHRVNILKDPKLMRGSQRRQYVRTFFGKDVSRFNSPRRDLSIVDHKVRYDVRMNRTAAAAATTTTNNNRVGNSFDSKNFNNGWGGRFG